MRLHGASYVCHIPLKMMLLPDGYSPEITLDICHPLLALCMIAIAMMPAVLCLMMQMLYIVVLYCCL